MGISRRSLCIGAAAVAVAAAGFSIPPVRRLFHPLLLAVRGRRSVEDRLGEFSAARDRVRGKFTDAGVAYPPGRVVLLGLKDERRLEVYAGPPDASLRRIGDYKILAASGGPGPKVREGDRQVPEGVYALESLNPNSRFHVALRVAYPNPLDAALARRDGRTKLGGDIMIHGGAASVGCLAMGDPAAEELFVLAAETGIKNVTIVLSPVDLRERQLPADITSGGQEERYAALQTEFARLPR